MRIVMDALAGWARMGATRSEEVRVVDAAITVVLTLLVAATFALLQR